MHINAMETGKLKPWVQEKHEIELHTLYRTLICPIKPETTVHDVKIMALGAQRQFPPKLIEIKAYYFWGFLASKT